MILFLVSVVLAAVVGYWVVQPVLSGHVAALGHVLPGEVQDAEARKRVALAALSEVEYDYAAGKLDSADYSDLRAQLAREAVDALREAPADAAAVPPPVPHGCGFVNPAGSRFCAGCGRPLA